MTGSMSQTAAGEAWAQCAGRFSVMANGLTPKIATHRALAVRAGEGAGTVASMTRHQGEEAAAGRAVDEEEAARRALKAQLSWDDPEQEPGKPCPCGSSDGLHGEACDCEDGAVLIHTMRLPGSTEDVTVWEDTFACTHGCNEYTETVTLPNAPWGVREQAVDRCGLPYERIRLFPGITHTQEELLPGFGAA